MLAIDAVMQSDSPVGSRNKVKGTDELFGEGSDRTSVPFTLSRRGTYREVWRVVATETIQCVSCSVL